MLIAPDPRVYDLLGEELLSLSNTTVEEANAALENVKGDLLYIKASLVPLDDQNFGLTCKAEGRRNQTTFTYYTAKETIDGYTSNRGKAAAVSVVEGALPLKDGMLTMEIFIDRSLVEGFFNTDKAISIRSYADPSAQEIKFLGMERYRCLNFRSSPYHPSINNSSFFFRSSEQRDIGKNQIQR